MTDDAAVPDTPLPPGVAWVGDWDENFGDRIFGADPITVGPVAALLIGVQNRDGSTVSGVALKVQGSAMADGRVVADLTPEQARELANVLMTLADRTERLDGYR